MNIDQLAENTLEGIWIIDEKNKTVFVNQTVAKLLGYFPEEFVGKEIGDFLNEKDVRDLGENLTQRKDGMSELHELRFVSKQGNIVWVSAACKPLFDENGAYAGAIGMISEINESKKNEVILTTQKSIFEILVRGGSLTQAMEQLLKSIGHLVEEVHSCILLLDEEENKLYPGASLDLSLDFLKSLYVEPINHNQSFSGTAALTKKLIISSNISNDPLWTSHKDLARQYGFNSCWSSPIVSVKGTVLGTFDMYFKQERMPTQFQLDLLRSITAAAAISIEYIRLYEEAKLHNEETSLLSLARETLAHTLLYEDVLKNIPDLIVKKGFADFAFICLKKDDGIFRTKHVASKAEISMVLKNLQNMEFDLSSNFGVSRAMKENISFINHPDQNNLLEMLTSLKSGTPKPTHTQALIDAKIKSYVVVPLSVRGEVIGGLTTCSSTRKYKQSDLSLMIEIARSCAVAIDNAFLYDELKISVQAREEFISIASHELRTPLSSLKMRIDLLSLMIERGRFPQDVQDKLGPIVSEIQPDILKFSKLVDTLLDITKLRAKKLLLSLETCHLSKIILEEALRIKSEFELHQIPLNINIEDMISGQCDQVRIQQVVGNLLSNALKFGSSKPVDLIAKKINDDIVIQVVDRGIGISKSDAERIFKPFERAVSEKHFGGLGLGLYITKQIVETHKGEITVKSNPQDGTIFTVRLPLITDS
jgi:PAS domain S-box-containing protein